RASVIYWSRRHLPVPANGMLRVFFCCQIPCCNQRLLYTASTGSLLYRRARIRFMPAAISSWNASYENATGFCYWPAVLHRGLTTMIQYSGDVSRAVLPPTAAVLTVTTRSVAKRGK